MTCSAGCSMRGIRPLSSPTSCNTSRTASSTSTTRVPHFFPAWVNRIRKRGIYYVGEPHRLWYAGGQRFYRLSRAEAEKVGRWWALSLTPAVSKRLDGNAISYGRR